MSDKPSHLQGEQMTIKDWAVKSCHDRGMFPNQANDVLVAVMEAQGETMKGRWDHQYTDYPPALLAVLSVAINHEALKYIDEKCPEAWFRAMFV